jgi:hypothetical protein
LHQCECACASSSRRTILFYMSGRAGSPKRCSLRRRRGGRCGRKFFNKNELHRSQDVLYALFAPTKRIVAAQALRLKATLFFARFKSETMSGCFRSGHTAGRRAGRDWRYARMYSGCCPRHCF